MTEKRFTIDNESDIIEFDYNTNEYIQDFIWADGKSWDRICNRLNELFDENEYYKSIFFELVETALTDKNCRELYCKGILDIFDKANSLNQARDMIKVHLND